MVRVLLLLLLLPLLLLLLLPPPLEFELRYSCSRCVLEGKKWSKVACIID